MWENATICAGAFLPLRKIRQCVPEFSVVNFIFLNLTVYNTEEIENSYRWNATVKSCNFGTDSFFITVAEEWAWACCVLSFSPRIHSVTRRNLLALVALNVSSVSIKQFDSIIALCTTKRVLSNTVALSNMLRRKNINLIQVTKAVGAVVNVMTEERNDPMVWDELCLGAELKWQPIVAWNPAWRVYV